MASGPLMDGLLVVIESDPIIFELCGDLPDDADYENMSRYGLYGYLRNHTVLHAKYEDFDGSVYLQIVVAMLVGRSDNFQTTLENKYICVSREAFLGFLDHCYNYQRLEDNAFKIDWRKAGF